MNLDEHLRDKETTHGTFEDTATIAQTLKAVMRRGRNWESLPNTSKETLDGAATLIARILNGDAADPKHWNGAAGYMRLRSNALASKGGDLESGISSITRRLRPTPMPRVNSVDEGGAA
jgi:hypothetical protein